MSFELNHQFYVDDLKLYARGPAPLADLIATVEPMVQGNGLRINAKKCGKAHLNADTTAFESDENLHSNNEIPVLREGESYRYLGIQQLMLTTRDSMERFTKQMFASSKQIFASDLTWKQKTHAFTKTYRFFGGDIC